MTFLDIHFHPHLNASGCYEGLVLFSGSIWVPVKRATHWRGSVAGHRAHTALGECVVQRWRVQLDHSSNAIRTRFVAEPAADFDNVCILINAFLYVQKGEGAEGAWLLLDQIKREKGVWWMPWQ